MDKPLYLQAIFSKASTTIDNGWRIQFDLSEFMGEEIAKLAQLRDQSLHLVIMTEQQYENSKS